MDSPATALLSSEPTRGQTQPEHAAQLPHQPAELLKGPPTPLAAPE
jgi:hypothetical protein